MCFGCFSETTAVTIFQTTRKITFYFRQITLNTSPLEEKERLAYFSIQPVKDSQGVPLGRLYSKAGTIVTVSSRLRNAWGRVTNVLYRSSTKSIGNQTITCRPHIHICQPKMACFYMIKGNISKHINGVWFGIIAEVGNNINTARDFHPLNCLLVNASSIPIKEECHRNRTIYESRETAKPIPTLNPEG